jgi:hypothetical protein
MERLKRSAVIWLAASLFTAPTTRADDALPPESRFSTPEGAVLPSTSPAAVRGVSHDEGSGVFGVEVRFCSPEEPAHCTVGADLGASCGRGCPRRYVWKVDSPRDLRQGEYRVTVSAVDDAWNWEVDGPSIMVTVP